MITNYKAYQIKHVSHLVLFKNDLMNMSFTQISLLRYVLSLYCQLLGMTSGQYSSIHYCKVYSSLKMFPHKIWNNDHYKGSIGVEEEEEKVAVYLKTFDAELISLKRERKRLSLACLLIGAKISLIVQFI